MEENVIIINFDRNLVLRYFLVRSSESLNEEQKGEKKIRQTFFDHRKLDKFVKMKTFVEYFLVLSEMNEKINQKDLDVKF